MTKKKSSSVSDDSGKGKDETSCCNEDNQPGNPPVTDAEKDSEQNCMEDTDLALTLEKAEKTIEELNERILRTMAEFDNYKKRVSREKEQLLKYGTEKFALDLLPVVDNFERAVEQAMDAEDVEAVVDGTKMILKQFATTLEKFHIKQFNSVGEPFNPEKHEAMAQQENSEYEENTVIQEMHKGYYIGDKLLRPARVIVSRKPAEKENL